MTGRQLASYVRDQVKATGSHFFDRDTMKFFGDTMANYRAREACIVDHCRIERRVYEVYRLRPVKYGLHGSAYFDRETFARVFKAGDCNRR